MNLQEFKQLYQECGEVVAKLRIKEIQFGPHDMAKEFPEGLYLMSISPYAWSNLLISHPQVQEYCDFNTFNGNCWAWLLAARPEFKRDGIWGQLTGPDWYFLLISQKEFMTQYEQLSPERRKEVEEQTPLLTCLPD